MTTNEKLMNDVLETMLMARSVFNTCYHDAITDLIDPARKDSLTKMIAVLTIMIERVRRENGHDNEQASR